MVSHDDVGLFWIEDTASDSSRQFWSADSSPFG
jgi:hypothetical protein